VADIPFVGWLFKLFTGLFSFSSKPFFGLGVT
jgi:hypothetical protein